MTHESRTVSPAFPYGTVRFEDGTKVEVPEDWALLEPGDATLTRRVKAAGPTWTMKKKMGRRVISVGVWAPEVNIERVRAELAAERETPEYQRKLEAGRARRAREQDAYVEDFRGAVLAFLGFHERHAAMAEAFADAVTAHATPVGSGTVARTKRIPVEQRAESAVIAWMRHQTTAYDDMTIARVKGRRREVRRELAKRSRTLLNRYRRGDDPPAGCPLARALAATKHES